MDNKLAQDVVDAWDAFNRIDIEMRSSPSYVALRNAIEAMRVPPPVIAFTFPLFVELPSLTNQRGHWTKHSGLKRRQRNAAKLECLSNINVKKVWRNTRKIHVNLTRIIQSGHKLDDDNLRPAFKSVRDGIAEAFLIGDGSDRWEWDYDQRKPEKSDPPGLTGTVAISWKG